MLGHPADLHRTVATRVATTNHQHALILKRSTGFVGVCVQVLTRKLLGNSLGVAGHIVVPIGHQEVIKYFFFTVIQHQLPALVFHQLCLLYSSIELDVGVQIKVPRVRLKIGQYLLVRRVIRIILRHGIIFEGRQRFRRNNVRCFTDTAVRKLRRVNPVAAYLAILLVANNILYTSLQ